MFREDKAIQMAARFLRYANGRMEYKKLIKLLYLADKKMLQRCGEPIVFDTWYSMATGPVLGQTYDLIQAGTEPNDDLWTNHIRTVGHDVVLQSDPGSDRLSRIENSIIDEVFAEYGSTDRWDLAKLTQAFPEWCNPGTLRIPIHYQEVLEQTALTQDEIRDILDNIASQDVLLSALSGISG